MVTIAGGIILAIVGLVAIVFLLVVVVHAFEWLFRKPPQPHKPSGRLGCAECGGEGRIEMVGGHMKFYVDCPMCKPVKTRR
jgi:hypothetical protein